MLDICLGVCFDGAATFYCQCDPGWSGDTCQNEIGTTPITNI